MSSKLSLLDLPPETRIQIYNYLSPVHSYARDYSGLHLSCRKIRSEYTYEALKSIRHSYKRLETKLAGYDISIIGTPESIFRTSTLSVELPQSYLSNPFRTIPAALIPWRWLCCKTLVVNINADHPYVHARLPVMRSLLERFTETVMRRSPTTVHEYFRMRPEKQFAIKEIVVQWRDPRFHHLPPSHSISAWYDDLSWRLQQHARLWNVNYVLNRQIDRGVGLHWRRRGLTEANCTLAGHIALVMLPGIMMAAGTWLIYSVCRNELVALAKMLFLLIRFVVDLILDYLSARYLR